MKREFQILKTEKRHALPGEFITPITSLTSVPPVCRVRKPTYPGLKEDCVDCESWNGGRIFRDYEYEVITRWHGDIMYAFHNYRLRWVLEGQLNEATISESDKEVAAAAEEEVDHGYVVDYEDKLGYDFTRYNGPDKALAISEFNRFKTLKKVTKTVLYEKIIIESYEKQCPVRGEKPDVTDGILKIREEENEER